MRETSSIPAVRPGKVVQAGPRDEISGSSLDPSQRLMWRRTVPLAADFELRQGDAVFGEMERSSTHGMDATGECLGHPLELRLETSFLRGIRVESCVSGADDVGPGFQGWYFGWGRIVTAEGEQLRWRHALTRMYDHLLIDSRGEELLRLRPTFLRFGRTETRVILRGKGWARSDLAELLLLTWFLRVHSEARGRRVFKRSKERAEHDFP